MYLVIQRKTFKSIKFDFFNLLCRVLCILCFGTEKVQNLRLGAKLNDVFCYLSFSNRKFLSLMALQISFKVHGQAWEPQKSLNRFSSTDGLHLNAL